MTEDQAAVVRRLTAEIERLKKLIDDLAEGLDDALMVGADRTLVERARRELGRS